MAKDEIKTGYKLIGTRPNRPDGLDKVTGRARYGADFSLPGMLWAAVVRSPHARPGPGGTMVYFSVDDCAVEQARVAAAGGKVLRPKFSIGPFGWVTLCMDTEGNAFGLNSMR